MKKYLFVGLLSLIHSVSAYAIQNDPTVNAVAPGDITIRTENYPRPPYSGATYYIYEQDGNVICTKLKVCNKYDECETSYTKGSFKSEEDIETGEPYGSEPAVVIAPSKLTKHVCLSKFKLIK